MNNIVKAICAKTLLYLIVMIFSLAWAFVACAQDDSNPSTFSINGPDTVRSKGAGSYALMLVSEGQTVAASQGTVRWSVKPAFATINSQGIMTAKAVAVNRTVTVTARYTAGNKATKATKRVTILAPPRLTGLAIGGPASVAAGAPAQLTATASFNDQSTRDVTSQVKWTDNSAYASVAPNGIMTATAAARGKTVKISAKYKSGTISKTAAKTIAITSVPPPVGLTGLSVSGPGTVASNSSASYTATASFSDGTTRDMTNQSSWTENSSYASISSTGVMTTTAPAGNQNVTVSAGCTYDGVTKTASLPVTLTAAPAQQISLTGLSINGPATVAPNSSASYTATASFSDSSTRDVTNGSSWSDNSAYATMGSTGTMTTTAPATNQSVTVQAGYSSGGVTRTATLPVTITASAPPSTGAKSINSTSRNSATLPASAVAEQTLTTKSGFQIFSVNDLGMHCGDLDHRVASILPPFNVLHAIVIQKGTSSVAPEILTSSDVDVVYSAASNPGDPALKNQPSAPIFKTNFWDDNPAQPGTSIAFDGYNPFYPPGVLSTFPLAADKGLPAPDLAQLYPVSGAGVLSAAQQSMPGASAPFSANLPQSFGRFDTDFPFFVNFSFGYRLSGMNWFAADGIPISPYDDFGRNNPFPLMRVQAKTKNANLTGKTNDVIASMDSVVPVSAEATCSACHLSAGDGGGGFAACIPGIDANCAGQGSPRTATAFVVARSSEDTSTLPAAAKKEWAADTNIVRLHDAKHGTHLQSSTPVVCQTCHYTPALDLAHVGPEGPGDANANGREQKVHRTNSRVMHAYHGQFTDLFPNDMPAPNNSQRIDPATGKPVMNTFVQNKLDQTCYQCHPGKVTQCLRGAMAGGGLICQDCHGGMQQVGNDFSANFSASTPYPAGADLSRRVPWANEPRCQSCHTGDAMSNLASDPNVIKATDGIRLLRTYRSNDADAKPILATNTRFAEETASNGNAVLYRFSKGHSGVFCQACHGSTHAEWPVSPESGTYIANDNMAATQVQGHTGKIMECSACHTAGSLPNSLGGPHGMHPVGEQRFAGGHENLVGSNRAACQACHGKTGLGTVLSKVSANRTFSIEGRQVSLTKGQQVSCNLCHGNPL